MPQLLCPGASKGGLDMLTKVMGLELGPHKVSSIIILTTNESPLVCYWCVYAL